MENLITWYKFTFAVCRKSYASHSFVACFLLLLLFFIIPFLGGSSRSEILLNVDSRFYLRLGFFSVGEWSGVDGGGPKSVAKGPLITGYRSHENVHETNVRVYVLSLLPQ